MVAGHKGQPEQIRALGRAGRRRRLRGARDRGTTGARGRGTANRQAAGAAGHAPAHRRGHLRMVDNVGQATIELFPQTVIQLGALVYTDEYDIRCCPPVWGLRPQDGLTFAGRVRP